MREVIGRAADRWTLLTLEVLAEHGRQRFGVVQERVGAVTQKVLIRTLRDLERDGIVTRTVHPVVPPKVEYELTPIGLALGHAFCGVWHWAREHGAAVEGARRRFDAQQAEPSPPGRRVHRA